MTVLGSGGGAEENDEFIPSSEAESDEEGEKDKEENHGCLNALDAVNLTFTSLSNNFLIKSLAFVSVQTF